MSSNLNAISKYNNYNSFINMSSSLNNNSNKSVNSLYNNANNYSNNLSSINNVSSFKDTFSKKISELQKYTTESKEFYSDFVDKFSDLKKSSNVLKASGSNSVFKGNTYGSDDTNVVSISKTGSYNTSDYKVEVSQIATGKSIAYNELSSNGNELVKDGSISINNGQNSYDLHVNTENASNNKDAMSKIAETVNKAEIGVKATVEEKDRKSALKFETTTTGVNSKLSVAFGNDLSNSISVKSTQEGKNANYKVNDVDYSSESNSIKLSSTVKASLNSVGRAKISSDNVDSKKIVEAVKTFAEDYNKVVSFLDENSSKSTNIKKLDNSFDTTKYNSSSLSDIGITVGTDGKLTINEKDLKNAISSDYKNVKDTLGGSSGTANQTYTKVQEAMNNSRNLYPGFQFSSAESTTYSFNNSTSALYSQYNSIYSSGLFLNSLI